MSWEALAPLPPAKDKVVVSAQVMKPATAPVRIHMFFAPWLIDEMGGGEKVDVLAGTGEHAGLVRLVFGSGPFSIKAHNGYRRFSIPAAPGAPDRSTISAPCEIISKDGKGRELIVALPLEQWKTPTAAEKAGRPPAKSARPTPSPKPAPKTAATPQAAPAPKPGALSAPDYLTRKGHDVEPLAGGRMLIDGDTYTATEVLALVNNHRSEAGLAPLTAQQIG